MARTLNKTQTFVLALAALVLGGIALFILINYGLRVKDHTWYAYNGLQQWLAVLGGISFAFKVFYKWILK